jgi:GNAT superfamily N-acetyltransferase
VIEIRQIGDEELERWVEVSKWAGAEAGTAVDYLDWRRQSDEMAWLLAELDAEPGGTAVALTGWHSPPRVGRLEIAVAPALRRRGVGGELLGAAGAWLRDRGCDEATAPVREDDGDSLAWAERRGYREIGRNSRLALDLSLVEAPAVEPPEGIEIVSWAEQPDVVRGMYEVACEAYPDVPGEDEAEMASFEDWLSADLQGAGDRPEATFAALAGDEVVGYAKFSISNARPGVAMHDMTGVKRAWRGRGIAGALKRAEIRWAKESGFTRLETMNEERNEPIRKLNERHGYRLEPGKITVRGRV